MLSTVVTEWSKCYKASSPVERLSFFSKNGDNTFLKGMQVPPHVKLLVAFSSFLLKLSLAESMDKAFSHMGVVAVGGKAREGCGVGASSTKGTRRACLCGDGAW